MSTSNITTSSSTPTNDVDESLYSRQLYVFGHEAQRRMQMSRVLLVNLRGVGVETAKNLILSGVKAVTLYDPNPCDWTDLSANFYLSEKHVGKPRAESCADRLAELNPRVEVTVSSELNESVILRHQVVVCTDFDDIERLVKINEFCRSKGIRFVSADGRGVFARVFCDFGNSFSVTDKNGEQPLIGHISSVTKGNPGVVTTLEGARHGLEDGDYVTFEEVENMTELNGSKARPIKVVNPFKFSIESTEKYSSSSSSSKDGSGGYFRQVKQPVVVKFRSLRDCLEKPGEFLLSDFGKLDRSYLMHRTFQALYMFRAKSGGQFPSLEQLVAKVEPSTDAQKKIVRDFLRCYRGQISSISAVVGGIAAQETLKACSGKFMPITQWFYFDAAECLPDEIDVEEFEPTKTRYDGQIAIFGRSIQKKILSLKYFLVGAGAIGCEMLKTFAMMGLGAGQGGGVHVTDMDQIERSNLSRQFLFRETDIKQSKSTCAARAVKTMNPQFNVKAWNVRVGADTENVFTDDFWDGLYGVCTALDNVQARLYVDQRCVFYGKPLLESGTLGTKGNTQVVVPGLTEHYGASRDPPEKGIPICTLKNFPYKIEHTIQWARDWFEGIFNHNPSSSNDYLRDPKAFLSSNRLDVLEKVHESLVQSKPVRFEQCVFWARKQFQEKFSNSIVQLLHNFPKDQIDTEGNRFWSGHKRAPEPIEFDSNDSLHMNFIVAAANLFAQTYGLNGSRDIEYFRNCMSRIRLDKFVPRDGVKIAANEKEAKEEDESSSSSQSWDVETQKKNIQKKLPEASKLAGYRMSPLEFEKDDDSNFHMDFVTATSNLRARNYRIKELDKHHTKRVAGKIIPAIATTTALVTGLVSLELYKMIQNRPLESYRNAFLNLALPLFALSEPIAPATFSHQDNEWSIWDKIDLVAPMTMKQFIDHFEKTFNVEVSMISFGSTILYSFFMNAKKRKERLQMNMEQVAPLVSKQKLDPSSRFLIFEVMCTDPEDDEDVDIPTVRYRIR